MNKSKLATLVLLPLSIALLSGCHSLKKTDSSAASTPAAAPMATAPAEAPAAPVAVVTPKPPVMEDVTISSTPSGATVVINGSEVGTTPLIATVDRAKSYTLTVKQAGYDLNSRVLKSRWTLFGGIRMPMEVAVKLASTKDPVKSLESAVASLDKQLKASAIDGAQYKQQLAEAARFYSQSK